MPSFLHKLGAVVAGTLLVSAAHAGIQIYTSATSFDAAVIAPAVDSFNWLLLAGNPVIAPIHHSMGAYSYMAVGSGSSVLWRQGSRGDYALSTFNDTDSLIFGDLTGEVSAIGGNFYDSANGFGNPGSSLVLTATDASGTVVKLLTQATNASFVGFVSSDGPILSMTVSAIQGVGPTFATVDNLVVARAGAFAQAAAVPEPSTGLLAIFGLGLLCAVGRSTVNRSDRGPGCVMT